jgi:methylated-DNA-[protein]-cysteine S-methyltransferase
MKFCSHTFKTPLGLFSLAVDDTGALVGTAFGDRSSLQRRLGSCDLNDGASLARAARGQIEEYFAGTRREFSLPVAARGSVFQHTVWSALRQIPFGETRSYGELAAELGAPSAARAVGRANATNPICLIVPCHRVIGADGSLTGFAFGKELKRALLTHEGALSLALV